MAKEYQNCEYHGKFEVKEEHDWQCPKCQKELYAFSQFRLKGILSNDAKSLMKRLGVKF